MLEFQSSHAEIVSSKAVFPQPTENRSLPREKGDAFSLPRQLVNLVGAFLKINILSAFAAKTNVFAFRRLHREPLLRAFEKQCAVNIFRGKSCSLLIWFA
jgi:hypothetical protein